MQETIVRCDKCGKQLDNGEWCDKIYYRKTHVVFKEKDYQGKTCCFELCEACFREILAFMQQKNGHQGDGVKNATL